VNDTFKPSCSPDPSLHTACCVPLPCPSGDMFFSFPHATSTLFPSPCPDPPFFLARRSVQSLSLSWVCVPRRLWTPTVSSEETSSLLDFFPPASGPARSFSVRRPPFSPGSEGVPVLLQPLTHFLFEVNSYGYKFPSFADYFSFAPP